MVNALVPNNKFLECIDDEFLDDFVNVSSGIPSLLMNILEKKDSNIGLKRMMVFIKHPEYESLDSKERAIAKKLLDENKLVEAQEFHINYALNFLSEYPQFKNLIKNNEKFKTNLVRNPLDNYYFEHMISKNNGK